MSRDRAGRTPLHYAALENDEALVRQLIAEGYSVNAQDREGFAPLHFAAQQNALEAAKALLEAGAKVDIVNKYGNTPLSVAAFASRGRGDMIQLLREAGADPWRKNHYGVSAVDTARMIGNYDVKQYFADLPERNPDESSESEERTLWNWTEGIDGQG